MARHRARRSTRIRAVSAAIGGGAIAAMAVLGMTVEDTAGTPPIAMPAMTVGATVTQTTPSASPAVGKAEPTIKGKAPFAAK
ncbi:hypothetical protein [Mycobacterium sp. 1164985.4]|uniref:hypothetical protein n=1 Tax=Mycobacterium sp. 1164985.4 TaxID=1834069 RepID=UPI000801D069|nr:hypothetical protein [Mycobacterium sp. 1164985.4]OBK75578.1 hypothetical protein A5650_17475 [Mycobacterium sp. 1164985.4]